MGLSQRSSRSGFTARFGLG